MPSDPAETEDDRRVDATPYETSPVFDESVSADVIVQRLQTSGLY